MQRPTLQINNMADDMFVIQKQVLLIVLLLFYFRNKLLLVLKQKRPPVGWTEDSKAPQEQFIRLH